MITLNPFFIRVVDIITRLRLKWGVNYDSVDNLLCVQESAGYLDANEPEFSIYGIKEPLPNGWYMLEMKIKSPFMRVKGRIHLEQRAEHFAPQSFSFPLHLEKICKRIIYVDKKSDLNIVLPVAKEIISNVHLRVVKVDQRFARSRMLMKLQALHPVYKASLGKSRLRGSIDTLNNKNNGDLWLDYCQIFDEGADVVPYPAWLRQFEPTPEDIPINLLSDMVEGQAPTFSIVMPVYESNTEWLIEAIESVRSQLYPYWQLCIADDLSIKPEIRSILENYALTDERIEVLFRKENGHISVASNSAIELVKNEWIVLLDHDDRLPFHALFYVAHAIIQNPDVQMIYSDEDKVDETGIRSEAYFKPDWNEDLFYSQNMFSHLGVYRTDLVKKVGGFRTGFEGAQDYDLALRCIEQIHSDQIHHIPRILYHWRNHIDSTASSVEAKPYALIAGERALNDHFLRIGKNAIARSIGNGYKVKYILPEILPLVSLIIPTRNGLNLIRQCVESILKKTCYPNYEILIVDNGSDDAAMLRYLKSLLSDGRITVIRDDAPFNYSALNNSAVKLAKGEIVGLINNDVEVINPEWLSEMVSHALRPEVGAVGARLWYSDDTIQHAGVILGVHGIAGHAHRFLPRGNGGYCGRAALIQSFSVVTAACLLVRKAVYEEMGGLNEVELQVACNDVDFCLRLREAGYRNIWTPYAELYHHESASRGFDDTPEKQARSAKEIAYMQQRWGDALLNDPAYNPNLSLDNEDFTLAWPPRIPSLISNKNGSL